MENDDIVVMSCLFFTNKLNTHHLLDIQVMEISLKRSLLSSL